MRKCFRLEEDKSIWSICRQTSNPVAMKLVIEELTPFWCMDSLVLATFVHVCPCVDLELSNDACDYVLMGMVY